MYRQMILQYASDLHLEFFNPSFNEFETLLIPSAPILVLAGDIGYVDSPLTKLFLEWCSQRWTHILWIFGNHEYYHRKPVEKYQKYAPDKLQTMEQKEALGRQIIKHLPNVHILQNQSIEFPEYPEYVFWGATFWTLIPKEKFIEAYDSFNDFRFIAYPSLASTPLPYYVEHWNSLHDETHMYLEHFLSQVNFKKKVVVITHHLPTYELVQPQYKSSTLNYGFASHSDDLIQHPSVVAWICGHSHGTYSISYPKPCGFNARGYPDETHEFYNPAKILTLDSLKKEVTEEDQGQEEEFEFI